MRALHDPSDYSVSQKWGAALKEAQSWGLIYNSVRHPGGHCIAAFRPPAISIPKQSSHLRYVWNGESIVEVIAARSILKFG
jgi:hypothetical protein